MIATGQKSRTIHKEELTMSETERRIKRNVEEHAKLHQKKKTVQLQQQQQSQSTRAQRKVLNISFSSSSLSLSLSLTSLSLSFLLISLSHTHTHTHTQGPRVSPTPTHSSSNETSPTSHSHSRPSHRSSPHSPSSKPANKKIKLTLSDGRSANLTLDPNTTFEQLQQTIEKEFK